MSLTVTVESVPGKIQHDEWFERTVQKCMPHSPNTPRPAGAKTCPPYNSINPPYVYYYDEVKEKYCQRIESPAMRKIKSVRVWLEPSTETSAWLGWGDMVTDGRASLRYMFPDKWMAGTWTPDGFVTTGTPDNTWNQVYYENWMKQLNDANFLAGDTATIQNLWSVTLPEVGHPEFGTTVLGLLGTFDPGDISGLTSAPIGVYTIDYGEINSNTKKHRAAHYPASLDSMSLNTTKIVLQFANIPLDLPGVWRIGVQIKMELAKPDYWDRTEVPVLLSDWAADKTRWFITSGETGYNRNDYYFFAYVLVSTPCNPLEEKGCWDDTY